MSEVQRLGREEEGWRIVVNTLRDIWLISKELTLNRMKIYVTIAQEYFYDFTRLFFAHFGDSA